MVNRIVSFFTSLRLTVVCLSLALLLVFIGTLAQVDQGLYVAQNRYFRSLLIYWSPKGADWRIPVLPGGYLLGGILLINLIAAHIKRFTFTKKKIGIFLIHAGLILLLLGQFATDFLQVESHIRLSEGDSKNYSESDRLNELVLVESSTADQDQVVAIPETVLGEGKQIRHPQIPFTLRVKQYYPNSRLSRRAPMVDTEPPPATQGAGQRLKVQPAAMTFKMDERNVPSAVVEILTPQGPLGTWLVSGFLDELQSLKFDNRTYQIGLRLTRYYKPFYVELIKFSHDKYLGTDIPKNFSSRIRLRRPETGEDREVLIYMNNPLRYWGETYYQASFDQNDPRVTILQVVRNPGWLTPYLSCALVALGLVVQFLSHLISFARKSSVKVTPGTAQGKGPVRKSAKDRGVEEAAVAVGPGGTGEVAKLSGRFKAENLMKKYLPWIFLIVFGAEALIALRPKTESGFHTREFGKLPVLLNGRVQPLDSVARNSLLQIRSTQTVPLEEKKAWEFWKHPKKLTATAWLMEVMMRPDQADERRIFLIHHPDLFSELKLENKGVENSGLHYFSFNELEPALDEIQKQGQRVNDIDPQIRKPFEKQVAKLHSGLILYRRLKNSLRPEASEDFAKELEAFRQAVPPGVAAVKAQAAGNDYDKEAFERILEFLGPYDVMARFAYPLIVPPSPADNAPDHWLNAGVSLMETARTGEIHPAMKYYAAMANAYHQGTPSEFNLAVEDYRSWLSQRFVSELNKGKREFFYSSFQPFYRAMLIYLVAFLLGCASWFNWSEALRRSAFYLVVLAGIIHTAGLVSRMLLEGRPPVTNLYSSALFIGWGAVVLGLILERFYRDGIGTVVASFIGFVTQIIAHNLALGGDTMEMLRAVLDTNFWLATHVVVITLGYASTFFAGFLAILYIIRGVFTRTLQPTTARSLTRMVYGIVCFATLFSFVGTILGGIWADQSWGRFWGWDPKENGALIIVLWNVIILHARWGGLVRERGLMNMAVFGNIVTSFSWFGVNMLGIGLHSYGFMDAAFYWLMLFVASQLLIICLGLLPARFWASFKGVGNALARDPSSLKPGVVRKSGSASAGA